MISGFVDKKGYPRIDILIRGFFLPSAYKISALIIVPPPGNKWRAIVCHPDGAYTIPAGTIIACESVR
ncbi:MAG: hypothetical protein J7L16_02280 [Deltaproteobacteria bacterium]|nr:hypothetical protein [Deltaproteobacteria bacterium]